VGGWIEEITGEPEPDTPLIEIATHEAGHAIIAAYFGMALFYVQIDPVKGCGEATPDTSSPWHYRPTARERLLIAQAGSAAQCQLRGEAVFWTVHGVNDRDMADGLAEEEPGLASNDFTEIGSLLNQPSVWTRIERLAQALLTRYRIEIPELRDFLRIDVT
jgi:hypothetical protein